MPAEWTGKSITPKTLVSAQSADKAGGKLTDHNAPSKPPEQIKRMIVVERINKLVDIGKVIAGKAYQRGKFTQAHGGVEPHQHNEPEKQPSEAS